MALYFINARLQQSTEIKFLGIIIQQNLNLLKHIALNIQRIIHIFSTLWHLLPSKTILILYYSLVHLHISYGIVIFNSTYISNLNTLPSLTKLNNAHYILRCDSRTCTYSQFDILTIKQEFTFHIAILTYKLLKRMFTTSDVTLQLTMPSQDTRSSSQTDTLVP